MGDIEFEKIQEFFRIRRREHFMADFAARFHLAFDKCPAHLGGSDPEPLSKKFISTLLRDTADISSQGRKVALATAGGNLNQTGRLRAA